jgi:ABC-type transport system involved in multi-copper enzyme maturation permease subunit
MPNFKLELTKILKSKKFILLLLLGVLIPSAVFYQNHIHLDRYGLDLFIKMQKTSMNMSTARMQYHERMEEVGFTPEEIEFHMALFTEMENEMRVFNFIPRKHESRYAIPQQMVAFYQAYQDYAEDRAINYNGRQFFYIHEGDDTQRVALEKAFFQELVDRGLPYEDPTYSITGFNFVKSVIDTAFGVPLAVLLLLLIVDIFTDKKANGAEKIRLIQPVKRINILFAKLAASLVYILAFIIVTVIVSYLLAGLLGGGFGSLYYPAEVDYGFISTSGPIGEYVGLAALYFCLYLLFITSGIALFAVIVKETSIVAALGILLTIIGSKWGASPSHFNPFSFLNFHYFLIRAKASPWTSHINYVYFPGVQGNLWIATGVALGFSFLLTFLAHYISTTTWGQNFTFTPKGKDGNKALSKYEKNRALPLSYFRFEALKIIKKGTAIIPFLLLLALAMLYGLNQYNQYEDFRNSELAFHQAVVVNYIDRINRPAPEGVNEELIDQSNIIKGYEVHSNALEAHKSGDIERITEAQKDTFLYTTSHWADYHPSDAITVYCATQDEIAERQVQPVYSNSALAYGGLVSSPFARESDLKHIKNWNIRNSQPSITYIFNSLFKNGLAIIALAIFAVSLALGFSDETQDTRTIYLLNTQPLHRRRIYFGKLLAQSAVFLSMILILTTVLFGGLRIAGSPVEKNFPAVQYLNNVDEDYTGVRLWRSSLGEHEGKGLPASTSTMFVGFTFRDMIDENIEMIAMLILSGLAMVAFAMLASQTIRHKIGVSLGTVLVFGLGYLASRYVLKGAGIFFPFIWLNSPLVATGEASMIFDITIMNSLIGILVLTLWLAAFVLIGYRMFSKTGRYQ